MDKPRKKRVKPNTEEERLTELPGCKMSLTRHQYLQLESLPERINICGDKEFIKRWSGEFQKELNDLTKNPDYQYTTFSSVQQHGNMLLAITATPRRSIPNPAIKGDNHEVLKMEVIRRLTEYGFKIISTVFDPNRGCGGAEKHMMCKEFQQATSPSDTDQASGNKASS